MSQSREREEIKLRNLKASQELQNQRIQKLVEEAKKGYEALKELLPEENPKAWKAILSLRAKLRRIRMGWLEKILDHKVPQNEKDILLGQYHAVLLFVDILRQTREINKGMVPGHEVEYIREKVFRNPNTQQIQKQGRE